MNNKFSDIDFREEELFKKFLEKQESGKSLFEKTEDEANELLELESLEYAENTEGELEHLSDILPSSKLNKEDYKGFFGKTKYYLDFVTNEESVRRLSCLVIPGFLVLMLVINIIVPSKAVSEKENRALARFPKISFAAIKDGSFSRGFEDYISDQFVFRNSFVSAKRRTETILGKKDNHGILFGKDGYLVENSADHSFENVKPNLSAIESLASVKRYNVTFALVPSAYEIMSHKLPKNSYTDVYDRLIDSAKTNIKSKNVKIANVKDDLKKHRDEYVYYRSDHHQTAHGSYYLYTALAKNLSYEPYSKDRFKVEEKAKDFLGTAWSNSGFASTREDTIYKFTFDENYSFKVSFPTEKKTMNSLYSDDMLKKKDKYAYYLDGNHGLAEIESSCPGDRKIAIIKDSYAHSLVPFLANHYSKIYMIDLRYYNADIFEYLYKSDIKDVLILYNQNTFMTDTNLSKITASARVSNYTTVPDINYGIVPKLKKADDSYFDDAVFVGDSLTLGLSYFSGFNADFLCVGGLSTKNLDTEPLDNGKTVLDTIASKEHIGKIYIMLGTNESVYQKPQEFIQRYSAFIDKVREHHPDCVVYIQSIMPISSSFSQSHDLKNHLITDHNKYLLELAREKQCYYIDVNTFFAGDDGYLPENAGGDGVHLSPENYRVMANYLKEHAVEVGGVKKIGTSSAKVFKGGKADTAKIAKEIVSKFKFKDTLSRVGDSLVLSSYGIDTKYVLSASLYVSGGSTAEEVAVFEADNAKNTEKVVECIKQRIENKKKDFENYIPAEMTKLNNPAIVVKGNIVVLCLADNADADVIKESIK